MTKKEIIAFIIIAIGVWSMFQAIIAIPELLVTIAGYLGNNFDSQLLVGLLLASLPVLLWGILALFVIKLASRLSCTLVKWASISGDETIVSIELGDILAPIISLLGLYFIISYLPSFISTLIRWFAMEAQHTGIVSASGRNENPHTGMLIELALMLAFAFFVFLRGRFIANLINKYKK